MGLLPGSEEDTFPSVTSETWVVLTTPCPGQCRHFPRRLYFKAHTGLLSSSGPTMGNGPCCSCAGRQCWPMSLPVLPTWARRAVTYSEFPSFLPSPRSQPCPPSPMIILLWSLLLECSRPVPKRPVQELSQAPSDPDGRVRSAQWRFYIRLD